MKDIVNWLRKVEHLAHEVYSQAAEFYKKDTNLKVFLDHISEAEAWHYHVMGSAAEALASKPDVMPAISIDKLTSDKIFSSFAYITNGIEQKTLRRDQLIDKIVELELSEWNDIFLYVVDVMKEISNEFKHPLSRIQAHIKEIEYFLEKKEGRPESLQKIKTLPPIWVENILIVDDEPMITQLIQALLNRSGNIDIADNGKSALKLMKEKYYKLIITDIDMPIMDGLTFYKEAVSNYPVSSKRFLFMSGEITPEREIFFKKNLLKYLAKPMEIKALRDEASKIIISQ
jgi:CheY-like chemotaxis protein